MHIIRDRARSVDLDEFLTRPVFAHLATLSEEGPRDSPVWFLWEDEAIWIIGSRTTDSFPARIGLDPRCAVGIVDFNAASGLVQHVGFRGKATIEPFDPERARRLLKRYLGDEHSTWDRRFQTTLDDPDNVFVRVTPESAVARDVSYHREIAARSNTDAST
jgi:hypothetical protein